MKLRALFLAVVLTLCSGLAYAQAPTSVILVPPATSLINVVPISATAAAAATSTLTIPAPAGGLSNYVCSLAYEISNNNTGTALSVVVSTSTNFNGFAVKQSMAATNSATSGLQTVFKADAALGGCPKSTVPGTATTFVSSTTPAAAAWTWYATYYQAP